MLSQAIVLLSLFLLYEVKVCSASNILIISTLASRSHSIWCNKLAELLVNRGHTVTVLDTDAPRKKLANLTTYTLEEGYDYGVEIDYLKISLEDTPKHTIDFLIDASLISCKNMLFSTTFKRFLTDHSHEKKPFDMIIHDISNCECFLGLVPTLGNPKLVLVTAFGEIQALYAMGSEGHAIHTPMQLLPYSHPLTFPEKLINLYYNLYYYYRYRGYVAELDGYSKGIFGQSTPHVLEIAKSASVALVNAHPILDGAKYYSPAIIHIPGFHVDEPKKLDAETLAFLDGANHGAIYFSLGSNILSSEMSKDNIMIFLNVFRTLKQRVLWKFEDASIKQLPANVKISKWFPQNDILAHPNIKMFITHCGLLSTHEAIHYGIPLVSIPIWLDQHSLTKKLAKKGVAVPLSYAELSEQSLMRAIQQVLTNTSYTTNMKKWSRIFRDRPIEPKELAVFWIESVLRNDDHKFLQPPETSLTTLELFLFDLKTISGILLGLIIAFLASSSKVNKQGKLKTH